MNKFVKKLATGAVSAAIALTAYAPAAFAVGDLSCTISGNGRQSINTCVIKVGKKAPNDKPVVQINKAKIVNGVFVSSSTGGNTVKDGTTGSGDMNVDTGTSTVTVTIVNTVNTPPTP